MCLRKIGTVFCSLTARGILAPLSTDVCTRRWQCLVSPILYGWTPHQPDRKSVPHDIALVAPTIPRKIPPSFKAKDALFTSNASGASSFVRCRERVPGAARLHLHRGSASRVRLDCSTYEVVASSFSTIPFATSLVQHSDRSRREGHHYHLIHRPIGARVSDNEDNALESVNFELIGLY